VGNIAGLIQGRKGSALDFQKSWKEQISTLLKEIAGAVFSPSGYRLVSGERGGSKSRGNDTRETEKITGRPGS